MPSKVSDSCERDVCRRYTSGESSGEIAKDHGVSISCIASILKRNGIRPDGRKPKTIPKRRLNIPLEEVTSLYLSGISENEIAKRFGVSRAAIRPRLLSAGVPIRDSAQANRLMMAGRSSEENFRNTQAAHEAARGKPQPEEWAQKVALGRERNKRHIGPQEVELAAILTSKGFTVTPQKAVGRYNIDIAISEFPIAVEVFGGMWHAYGPHARRFRKRFDYLLDCGWIPVIVWISKDFPLGLGAVKYICSLAERLRSGKSVPRQEQVIRGDGKPTSIGKANIDYRAAVGGDKSGDFVRGKDGRFTREAARV